MVDEWILEFEQPAGQRVLGHGFIGIECGWGDPDVTCDEVMWWDMDNRRWIRSAEFPWGRGNSARDFTSTTMAPCRSYKAFLRHLRRHAGKVRGRDVRLVSRYMGCDIVARPAQAMEARRAETGTGSVHDSAVPEGNAP